MVMIFCVFIFQFSFPKKKYDNSKAIETKSKFFAVKECNWMVKELFVWEIVWIHFFLVGTFKKLLKSEMILNID